MLPRLRLFLCAVIAGLPAWAAEKTVRTVVPGVQLTQIVISADENGGPALVNCLTVDVTHRGIRLVSGLGGDTVEEGAGGRESVNRQVARTGALAGINADFFPYTGDPLGLVIRGGELISEPTNGRGAIGFSPRGQAVIGRPVFTGAASKEDGTSLVINGLNRKPGNGETVLFASVYGDKTPSAPATVVVLKVSSTALKPGIALKAKVLALSDESEGIQIPARTLVLTATGAGAEWLKKNAQAGETLYIKADLYEEGRDWSIVREAVGGGPVLLRDGKEDLQLEKEHMARDFSTTRHPRTAVGVTQDGKVMLVVVDGRQALSRGMSLPELTATMKELGAVDAVNLDGGGSSVLSVRGLVINSPSDGKVRPVANALLVYSGGSKRPPAFKDDVLGAEPLSLASDGTFVNIPMGNDNKDLLYGTDNGGAFVSQKGLMYGYKPGAAVVRALDADGKAAFSRQVNVISGKPAKMLLSWTDSVLTITVRDANNNPLAAQEVTLAKPDGTSTVITTGADGKAPTPAGWLKDAADVVTVTCGTITRTWPEPAA